MRFHYIQFVSTYEISTFSCLFEACKLKKKNFKQIETLKISRKS